MIKSEREKVIPVFGSHEIDSKALFEFRNLIDRQAELPQTWIWSELTISRVQRMKPRLLAIDGLTADTRTNRLIFYSPGNPLDLQPCVFVGADLPIAQFMGKNTSRERKIAEVGIRDYWMNLTSGSAIDPNQEYASTRILGFAKQGLPELLGLLAIAMVESRLTGHSSDLLQQVILFGGVARILFNRNGIRRIAPFVDYKTLITLSRLTRPLLMKTSDVEIRNAVAAMKLAEIRALNTELDAEKTDVILFGSHHANGSNLWNDPEKQHRIIQSAIEKVALAINKEASRKPMKPTRNFKEEVERVLNGFFSRVTLWRFDRVPENASTIKAINTRLIREDSYSPFIREVVQEVVRNF